MHKTSLSCRVMIPNTLPVAFPPQSITNALAEWLVTSGIKRGRIAGLSSPAPTILFVQGSCNQPHGQRWKSTRASRSSSTAAVEKQFENEKQHMVHRFKSRCRTQGRVRRGSRGDHRNGRGDGTANARRGKRSMNPLPFGNDRPNAACHRDGES
ncbi:hypothetical protein BD779DRAFT_1790488 [Infundibulicybe gibba]|nr:hypothetical protein BD779DRAFT_1790488 [Infundibulicybe gibba]